MSTNGIVLNNVLRVEIDANDISNLISNHSGQTGNASGWAADTGITLGAATSPTRNAFSTAQTLGGTYTGGKVISAAYGSTAAAQAEVRSPAFAVVPGRHVSFQVSFADSRIIATPNLRARCCIRYYDAGSTLIGSTGYAEATLDASGDNPWVMSLLNPSSTATPDAVSTLVPPSAATARIGIIFYDNGSTPTKINRTVYLSRLMVVQSDTKQQAINVPFSDAAVWQNILGSSTSARITRGGDIEGVTDDIEPGMLTITITDSTFDPARNARARRGRRVRLMAAVGGAAMAPLFTGRVSAIDVDYTATKGATTYRPQITITANDAVTELINVPAPYAYGGTYAEKVRAIMALSTVPFAADSGTASTTKTSLQEDASAWDQLLLARNSFVNAKAFVTKDGTADLRTTEVPVATFGFGAGPILRTLTNLAINPSFELYNNTGGVTELNYARDTAWSASGQYSMKLSSAVTNSLPKGYYPQTPHGYGRLNTSGAGDDNADCYFAMTATVKAIVACQVKLWIRSTDSTVQNSVTKTFAAGEVATLVLPKAPKSASKLQSDYYAHVSVYQTSGAEWNTVSDLIYVDKIMVSKIGGANASADADYLAGRYFDGDFSDASLGSVEWTGSPHTSTSRLQVGAALSYLDYSANTGSKSLVNSLLITRTNVSELGGEKTYGPYQNAQSVANWGIAGAEINVVDGVPADLAANYLAKYSNPSSFVSQMTFDATHPAEWTAGAALVELYQTVLFQNPVSMVYGKYYVIGIEHDITPDEWIVTVRFRPLDQVFPVTVTNASGSLTSGPLDVIGPTGRAAELGGSINLNNFTAPGDYVQSQNTEAASGLNYPVPLAGLLEVSMSMGQEHIFQRYTVFKSGTIYEGTQWIRTWYANAWSPWKASVPTAASGVARVNANVSLANNAWTTLTAWTTQETVGLDYASGVWTTQVGGLYRVHFTLSFGTNTTGVRGVRPYINGVPALNMLVPPVTGFQTVADVSQLVRLSQGNTIACQAFQNSGAALNILGDSGGVYSKADIAKVGD